MEFSIFMIQSTPVILDEHNMPIFSSWIKIENPSNKILIKLQYRLVYRIYKKKVSI